MDDLRAAFGLSEPPAPEPPAQDPPVDNPKPEDPPAPEPNPAPETDPNPTPTPPDTKPAGPKPEDIKPPAVDKTAQAFASQRIQIKEYQKTLNGIAKVLGVKDTANPETVMASLNDLLLKAEAKAQNVPEDMYKRLHTLEERDLQNTQKQIRETAYFGFQKVKDTFNLDNTTLNKFADDLLANGVNPFENPVDLVKEYRSMHFDDLITAAVQTGIRQEAERAAKAAEHSSTPSNRQNPGGGADPEKITTVAQLDAWFNKQTPNK